MVVQVVQNVQALCSVQDVQANTFICAITEYVELEPPLAGERLEHLERSVALERLERAAVSSQRSKAGAWTRAL
jgi:hypothetical protein